MYHATFKGGLWRGFRLGLDNVTKVGVRENHLFPQGGARGKRFHFAAIHSQPQRISPKSKLHLTLLSATPLNTR